MPISLRVPDSGAQLAVVAPDKAQPNQLYILGFKGASGGEQGLGGGPIVMARQMDDQIQIGPLPDNTDPASIERLVLLPPVQRVEVEGMLSEERPAPLRVIEILAQHAAQRNVVIHL